MGVSHNALYKYSFWLARPLFNHYKVGLLRYLLTYHMLLLYTQNEATYHAVDGTDGHVDMEENQLGKKKPRKDKKVDLDNLKREVEMVRFARSTHST